MLKSSYVIESTFQNNSYHMLRSFLFTSSKQSFGKRLCFYTGLSVILFTGGVSASGCMGVFASGSGGVHPPGQIPLAHIPWTHLLDMHPPGHISLKHIHSFPLHTPLYRWPLKWAVRILLECILVYN